MGDILKEAIADAKAVRETALQNAKVALEEAFTPKIQSMLSSKLKEMDLEEDDFGDEEEEESKQSPIKKGGTNTASTTTTTTVVPPPPIHVNDNS